jgi:hypothetical protein
MLRPVGTCLFAPLLAALVVSVFSAPAGAVQIDFVIVGDPGNPADTDVVTCCDASQGTTGYGSVDYLYRIAKYELTNTQYAEFLNAVAKSDPNLLYNAFQASFGITRSGASGNFSYQVTPGWEQRPAHFVNFFDGARFANWLHNGQPLGFQDATTTEDGAYTLLGLNPLGVPRNDGALYFVPSDDEWYKAAYWDPDLQVYYNYPTGSNTPPSADIPDGPPPPANTANYWAGPPGPFDPAFACDIVSPCEPTDVGAYVNSPSPFGTFDQGGNLFELTEAVNESGHVIRGGYYLRRVGDLSTVLRTQAPLNCENCGGLTLRVAASVPEPGSGLLVALGLLALRRARRSA